MNASQTVPADAGRIPTDQVKALGNVLVDIAAEMHALSELLISATQDIDDNSKDAMIRAGRSLAERVGALADRASRSCGCGGGQRDADAWLHPPTTIEALQRLEARHV